MIMDELYESFRAVQHRLTVHHAFQVSHNNLVGFDTLDQYFLKSVSSFELRIFFPKILID